MKKTVFDPGQQLESLSGKIVVGLERISQAFKVLLWEKAKELGISPIQIQLLIFVSYHNKAMNNVSSLANEFNVTKPTISDAVKVLYKKGLITKAYLPSDSRSYTIKPSTKGSSIVRETENFADPITKQVATWPAEEQKQFFASLSKLIYQLTRVNVLTVQRTCYACRFLTSKAGKHYCNFLNLSLEENQIRLDCAEFEQR